MFAASCSLFGEKKTREMSRFSYLIFKFFSDSI